MHQNHQIIQLSDVRGRIFRGSISLEICLVGPRAESANASSRDPRSNKVNIRYSIDSDDKRF